MHFHWRDWRADGKIIIPKISGSKKHEADVTGNSKHYIDQYNINFPNHIRVECTDWSKDIEDKHNWGDNFNVSAVTKEINSWFLSGYK